MQTRILHIFTRTPLHVGAGSSVGAIDQPVIRERHTGFPIIPGSAIKGVLRDYVARRAATGTDGLDATGVDKLFGTGAEKETAFAAGEIGFGEARLLAFPLRSAKGSFALATCPLALARHARDAGLNAADFPVPAVADGQAIAGAAITLAGGKVALEEYIFNAVADAEAAKKALAAWSEKLAGLLDDAVLREARTRLVILSDGDFSHFAVNACTVSQHVRIDNETGTVADGALFNTETVPSETLFYAPLHDLRRASAGEDSAAARKAFNDHFTAERLLQFGGDGTTGLGFATVKLA
ncbi:MAG: type III-B CRISPR module RAMP protein Cmr4 [Puniceicoccales bacterium]|nr:type III-B CRISPR module RAMP protein Cmr4 [Puniceicoccales bacterium]